MHPLVRDLFRRIIYVGREYPLGLAYVKRIARKKIADKRHLTAEADIKRAVHEGRWWVREMIGATQLRKYRAMKRRYYDGRGGDGLVDPDREVPPSLPSQHDDEDVDGVEGSAPERAL